MLCIEVCIGEMYNFILEHLGVFFFSPLHLLNSQFPSTIELLCSIHCFAAVRDLLVLVINDRFYKYNG